MNKEQAKAWLPLIQAVAEGKTLQLKHRSLNANTGTRDSPRFQWKDYEGQFVGLLADVIDEFRIKPEPKKQSFRVALLEFDVRDFGAANKKNVYVASAVEGGKCDDLSKQSNFIRWLTDRIEYELPEGEA